MQKEIGKKRDRKAKNKREENPNHSGLDASEKCDMDSVRDEMKWKWKQGKRKAAMI